MGLPRAVYEGAGGGEIDNVPAVLLQIGEYRFIGQEGAGRIGIENCFT